MFQVISICTVVLACLSLLFFVPDAPVTTVADVSYEVLNPEDIPAEVAVRQRLLYEQAFGDRFNPSTDGALKLSAKPDLGAVACVGDRSGTFVVEAYIEFDYFRLLRAQGTPAQVIYLMQNPELIRSVSNVAYANRPPTVDVEDLIRTAENPPQIGIAWGTLDGGAGSVPVEALTLATVDEDGNPAYAMIPATPGSFAYFEELWVQLESDPGDGDPPGGMPVDGVPTTQPDCYQAAIDECGEEPPCNPSTDGPGIQECMRAAGCRQERCSWASCVEVNVEACENGYDGTIGEGGDHALGNAACGAAYLLEIMACLPSFLWD